MSVPAPAADPRIVPAPFALRRRLWLTAAAAALACRAAHSQLAPRRIGFLSPTTPQATNFVLDGLRRGLRESGLVEGTHITIAARYAEDRFDRLPALARELAELPVDVLVTFVTQASLAAQAATRTIPIVMVGVSDPVASGLVASLSRPGGNVTGTSAPFTESAGKGLQLLKEAIPTLQRVAVLRNPGNTVFQRQMLDETRGAARALGLELLLFEANDAASIDAAFAAIARQRVSALDVLPDPVLSAHWERIAAAALRLRLPSITVSSSYAAAGGLMTYGPSLPEMARISGGYVARILRGQRPSDLPVELPTRFELVINRRTADALGLKLPQALLLRAEKIID